MADEDDEPYENTLTLDELRREYRRLSDERHAFNRALKELPEIIPPRAAWAIVYAASYHHDIAWAIGKELQSKHGAAVVPPKSELECAAGLWSIIREAVLAAVNARKP